MEGEPTRYRIGELARPSGLSVKTVRFYSDRGLVPAAERSGAGYRLYDERALAQISDAERKRIVTEFLDEVLSDLDIDPGLEGRLRGGLPELPDEPSPEQVEAWVELAELVRDPDFRARIRRMAEAGAAARGKGDAPDGDAMRRGAALVAARGGVALEAGIEPGSEAARPIVAEIAAVFGGVPHAELADRFEQGADPRAERYWQLLAVINGWPPVSTTMSAWRWTIEALRSS